MKWISISLSLIVLLSLHAQAQVQLGESNMTGSATVTAGYNDGWSNQANSEHNLQFGGTGDVSGSYYTPQFLSYTIHSFYNQSRENSDYQSISDASGINGSANLFSGGNYPASISYSKIYNSSASYGIPELSGYTTHGNSDALVANWGLHKEDLPSLHLGFSEGNNDYSIYGLDTRGTNHFDLFTATSAYRIAGFNLNGGYQYNTSQANTPQVLTSDAPLQSTSDGNSLYFGLSHNLPFHGSYSGGWSRSTINTASSGFTYDTTINTLNSGVTFAPAKNLTVGTSAYYDDNLAGSLFSSLVSTGAVAPETQSQQSSHALSIGTYASYDIPDWFLHLRAGMDHQEQSFLGASFVADTYNEAATYSRPLLGGFFTGVLGATESSLNTTNQSSVGLNTSASYTHRIQRWTLSASGSYSQNTQTVLVAYTTSGYNYGASVGRKLSSRSYWSGSVSGARSLLTNQPGSANSSQSYSTSLSLARYTFSGSYSKSSGNALLTSTGLVPTPVPVTVITPAAVVLYNGSSYSVGLGTHPIQGLTLTATFAKALSETRGIGTLNNNNHMSNLNIYAVYQVRKLNFTTGFEKLNQGFSAAGGSPTTIGTFYVGISRWFGLF